MPLVGKMITKNKKIQIQKLFYKNIQILSKKIELNINKYIYIYACVQYTHILTGYARE
jgi:hypothetical protein